jgi:hypothetical protein
MTPDEEMDLRARLLDHPRTQKGDDKGTFCTRHGVFTPAEVAQLFALLDELRVDRVGGVRELVHALPEVNELAQLRLDVATKTQEIDGKRTLILSMAERIQWLEAENARLSDDECERHYQILREDLAQKQAKIEELIKVLGEIRNIADPKIDSGKADDAPLDAIFDLAYEATS